MMGIGLARHNGQTGIQQQNPLLCPRNQASVVWNIASEIRFQFLVDVYKGRRNPDFLLHGKRQPMSLSRPMIGILPQYYHPGILIGS